MNLQQIYDLGIEMGIAADPRGEEAVKKFLAKTKKEYDDLPEKKKKYFDTESLKHPYADSRFYLGDPKKEVKKIIAGIDATTAEFLLVDLLNKKGEGIDAVIVHHPYGIGLAGLHEVGVMMEDIFAEVGVPVNVSHAIMEERIGVIKRSLVGRPNHNQELDAARFLDIPVISFHTVWDNMTWKYLTDYIAKKPVETLGELLDYLEEIPEFEEARKYKAGPFISSGNRTSRVGKVVVECTGGTNAGKEIHAELSKAGIGTVIQMHISEEERKEMQKYHINAIDIGHIPADSIGGNLFLDELEKKGIAVMNFGGLVRIKRKEDK